MIRRKQKELLKDKFNPNTRKLIIVLTPGYDNVSGGILSISSIFKETKKLGELHQSETILCNCPGDPALLRYTKFKNNNVLYSFSEALKYFSKLENLIIHVPEVNVSQLYWSLSYKDRLRLSRIKKIQINILLQNIEAMPAIKNIHRLGRFGQLTCTTAHIKYSTPALRKKLGFPLHHLSAYASPEQYFFKPYDRKNDLMIVSPDRHWRKDEVLKLIAQRIPKIRIQIIKNLTYEQYKETISNAKWSLTFGEGFDGYFVETIFSGGIGFSVYNDKFFPKGFKNLMTVYDDYDLLIERIIDHIKYLDNESRYTDYQKTQFDLCHAQCDFGKYVDRLKAFYSGNYTFN
jgi:hypothetical protein